MTPEHENATPISNGIEKPQVDSTDDRNKASRLPRWTREETIVLIQGKKIAENRATKSRSPPDHLEPKWDWISSYCKRHGVYRKPNQCRKRWGNLLTDFKKIKTWDSRIKEESESFWMMRNDGRRDKKLPGFFDREVYDVLDGKILPEEVITMELITEMEDGKNGGMEIEEDEEDEEVEEIGGVPEEIIGTESPTKTVITPMPISFSGKQYQPVFQDYSDQGTTKGKQPGSNPRGSKRRKFSVDECEDTEPEERLIKILERNGNMLNAQLETQNMNCQLDRDQRKDHTNSLVASLDKIADALVKIADKL